MIKYKFALKLNIIQWKFREFYNRILERNAYYFGGNPKSILRIYVNAYNFQGKFRSSSFYHRILWDFVFSRISWLSSNFERVFLFYHNIMQLCDILSGKSEKNVCKEMKIPVLEKYLLISKIFFS